MAKETWIKIIAAILLLGGIFAGGFFLGRAEANKHQKTVIVTKYIKGDPVEVYVDKPVPYEVVVPVDTANFIKEIVSAGLYGELFPSKTDTTYIPVKEDSSAVIKDYMTLRTYKETFFDNDSLGRMDFTAEVQFNRMMKYDYTFVPVYKTITETKYVTRKFSPYIGAGIMTTPSIVVQGGVFFDETYGVAVQYNYDWRLKKNDFGLIALYKF